MATSKKSPKPAEPETPKRVMPKRIVEVALPEPYDEFHIHAWANHPRQLALDTFSRDAETVYAAWQQIVVAHDLVDFEGEPYPPSTERAFWEQIPNEVVILIVHTARTQVGRLDPTKSKP